jgi:hypothetical protein
VLLNSLCNLCALCVCGGEYQCHAHSSQIELGLTQGGDTISIRLRDIIRPFSNSNDSRERSVAGWTRVETGVCAGG